MGYLGGKLPGKRRSNGEITFRFTGTPPSWGGYPPQTPPDPPRPPPDPLRTPSGPPPGPPPNWGVRGGLAGCLAGRLGGALRSVHPSTTTHRHRAPTHSRRAQSVCCSLRTHLLVLGRQSVSFVSTCTSSPSVKIVRVFVMPLLFRAYGVKNIKL